MDSINTKQKDVSETSFKQKVTNDAVLWESIVRKEGFQRGEVLRDTQAETAANYTVFFTAWHPCEILGASEVHGTKATDAGAVTLQLEKLTGTTAKGSGDTILVTAWDLKGADNTVVNKSGTDFDNTAPAVATDGLTRTQFSPGERLALKTTGTLTDLKDVQVEVYFKILGRGHYLP